jgi:hypothetical protein
MITEELRERAYREFREAVAREKAEKAAKEAAKSKAVVLPMPLEEEVRRAITNRRPGVWRVVPDVVTNARADDGPTMADEWEMLGRLEDE